MELRKASDRGHFDFGWLKTHHTFSFGSYYDPKHIQFGPLRVMNEDWIEPGQGFGTHPHKDMEIITYVMSGMLSHKDSMGNGSDIPAGDFQYMSAGKGVTHSEFNHKDSGRTHLYQIWILPDAQGYEPRYEQVHVSDEEKSNVLKKVISGEQGNAPIKIRQNVNLFNAVLDSGKSVECRLDSGRQAWIQCLGGKVSVGGQVLRAGDGLAMSDVGNIDVRGEDKMSELLLFDLPSERA